MTTRNDNSMGKHLKYPTRCSSCGAQLKYSQAHALRYCKPLRYAHAGNHMCRACYMKCYRDGADTATFEHQPTRRAKYTPRLSYPTPCSSCGATLKYPISQAKAQKRPYRYAHAGHGLCQTCFAACRKAGADPATFKHEPKRIVRHKFPCPCVKCGREMTYPHDGTWPGHGVAHAGRGLCIICYHEEKNEKRKAARRAAKHKEKRTV